MTVTAKDADIAIKRRFKIHALGTCNNYNRKKADNGVFYETEAEALAKAESYAQDGEAMVVYEARYIVRPARPPVDVIDLLYVEL
jgi:hypothetical protein